MNKHILGFTCTCVINTYITKKSGWRMWRVSWRKQLYLSHWLRQAFHKCNLKNAVWSWIGNQQREDNTIDQLMPNNQCVWLQGKRLSSDPLELHFGKLPSVVHSTERKAFNWIGQKSRWLDICLCFLICIYTVWTNRAKRINVLPFLRSFWSLASTCFKCSSSKHDLLTGRVKIFVRF